jgi:signal transduction histidine kinase
MRKKVAKVFGVDLTIFKHPISEDSPLYETVMHEKKCLIWKGFKEMADQIPAKQLRSSLKTLSPLLSRGFGIKPGEGSIMVAPLRWGEEIIGVLFLGHKKLLNVEDYHHLEYFLDQVGIAIAKSEGEKKVRQSLDELRELDQMKSEFIDIASHELRTPLTTLKLYLEMIAREKYGKLSPQLGERIRVMQEGVNRLEEIINQTLVASRLIKDKLELEEKEVSIQDVVAAIVNQFHPLWKKKRQNILMDVTPDLPLIRGDEKALSAAVANLVDNAIRYSPENSEIYITFLKHPAEVECVITDQGCGIPPEYAEKIFEEFYIVPSKTEYARQDGRTGLGLFIARGIIERHSGRIWMESVPGKGSTFHFVLPKKLKKGLTVK